MKVNVIIACILMVLATKFVHAKDIYVPGDYPTIQEAINAAIPDDRVIVAAGTYEENIVLQNFVDVIGAGTDITTITFSNGNVVFADNITGRFMKFDGFTINGQGTASNGIYCYDQSNFTISNNIITQCATYGILCNQYSSPTISNNTIQKSSGDGIFCNYYSSPIISKNIIQDNPTGIRTVNSNPNINNNTIRWNDHEGISCIGESPIIEDNLIYLNGYQGIICNSSSPTINGNEITQNGYDGICLNGSSSPIEDNIITQNSTGIWFSSSSSSKVRGNIIIDNWFDGIYISVGNFDLGTEADPGMNTIHDNGGYDVNNQTENTVMAEMNWWGQSPPDTGQFFGDVDYEPYLEVSPVEGSLFGIVTDADTGKPLTFAFVIAINADTKEKYKDFTDVNGYYEILNLPPATYWVICIKKGYKAGIKKAEVLAGETTTVDFQLLPK